MRDIACSQILAVFIQRFGVFLQVTDERPHTWDRLSVWMCIFAGVSVLVSGYTRHLHTAAFIGVHTNLVQYLILLHFVGVGQFPHTFLGSFGRGFEELDVQAYAGDVLTASAQTLILYLWPMLMAHAEVARYEPKLIEMYVHPLFCSFRTVALVRDVSDCVRGTL